MAYWLMKSEPNCYSIDDLKRDGVTPWDGVRNYQARNMLRDEMKLGDQAFFYHSNCDEPGIVGVMEVVKTGYPDLTALDPENEHYDPSSTPDNPRWYRVDVKFKQKFSSILSLSCLKTQPVLETMRILQKGNRLSVTPVSEQHWQWIMKLSYEKSQI